MIPRDMSWVANHLWQSTFFALAAGLLTLPLRRNRAAVRYWIWFAASLKFLIPFSLLVSLGNQFEWRTAAATTQPQFTAVMNEISYPFDIPADSLPGAAIPSNTIPLSAIVLAVWLCGVVLGLIFWIRVLRQTAAIRRGATALHLNLSVVVLQADRQTRMEPGVFGIVKPALILPHGITDTLTPAQLDAVLVHELHHVRRKDNLTAAIHMLVEIAFWFHPLVWWIRHRLMEERERACDEAVASQVRDPQIYAEAILNVCKLYVGSPAPCVSGVTGSNLKNRLEAIMKNRIALRLNFARKAVLTLACIATLAVPLITGIVNSPAVRAQTKDPRAQKAVAGKIAFEVASIKLAATPGRGPAICLGPCSPGERLTVTGTHVDIRYMPVIDLLTRAYRVKPYQVTGPEWMRKNRFDIVAKMPDGVSADRLPEMLQALLADRFKLTLHRETKELPVYALVVGKNGIKLQPSAADADTQPAAGPKAMKMFTPEGDAHFENGRITISAGQYGPARSGPGGKWEMLKLTMPALAELLTGNEDHPVIDQTNLPGAYRFTFEITMKEGSEGEQGGNPVLISMLDSVDKGGLKLERRNAPVETIVVDRVEKLPSEN